MRVPTLLLVLSTVCTPVVALAADVAMSRVISCEGDDAKIEVYIPQTAITGGDLNVKLARPIVGAYALDITSAGKGKHLEPVRVHLSTDKKTIVVDQYTRKLPPTSVPVSGGIVSFDNRFASNVKCSSFNHE